MGRGPHHSTKCSSQWAGESHPCLLSLEVGSLRPGEVLPGNSLFLIDGIYAVQCKRQITNLLQVFITVLAD